MKYPPAICVALSPDGKTVAMGGESAPLQLLDVASGDKLVTLPEQYGIHEMVLEP